MLVTHNCVFCGKKQSVEVDPAGYSVYCSGVAVQRALPNADAFTREFLISHMCFDCQSKEFNQPKPGEDWGEQVTNCVICDCAIWPKDSTGDSVYKCPSCGCVVEVGGIINVKDHEKIIAMACK